MTNSKVKANKSTEELSVKKLDEVSGGASINGQHIDFNQYKHLRPGRSSTRTFNVQRRR